MEQAYVLVQTRIGEAEVVADRIHGADGVVSVDIVNGPYDLVVRAHAPTLADLRSGVVDRLAADSDVTRALLCPVNAEAGRVDAEPVRIARELVGSGVWGS